MTFLICEEMYSFLESVDTRYLVQQNPTVNPAKGIHWTFSNDGLQETLDLFNCP